MKTHLYILTIIVSLSLFPSLTKGHIDIAITAGSAGGALLIGVILGTCCTLCLTCCIYKITSARNKLDFDVQLRTRGDVRMGPTSTNDSSSIIAPREEETTLTVTNPVIREREESVNIPKTREMPLPLFHTVQDRVINNLSSPENLSHHHQPNTLPHTSNSSIANKDRERGGAAPTYPPPKQEYAIPYVPTIEEYDIPYVPPTSRNTSETRLHNKSGGMTKSLSVDELKRFRLIREEESGRDPEQQYHATGGGNDESLSEHYYFVKKSPHSHFTHQQHPLSPFSPPPNFLKEMQLPKTLPFAPPNKAAPHELHKSKTALPMVTMATKTPPPVAAKPRLAPEKPAYVNIGFKTGKK